MPTDDAAARGWTVLVPLKAAAARKTRLAPALDPAARVRLTEGLFAQVVGALEASAAVARIVVLSPARPPGWDGELIVDAGRGLNAELTAASTAIDGDLAVVHADLPLMRADDVGVLIAAAAVAGVAIAPDRHDTGTNGLALRAGSRLRFAFGPDSLALHRAQAPGAMLVRRIGLALDLDTPADLVRLAPMLTKRGDGRQAIAFQGGTYDASGPCRDRAA